MLRYKKCSFLIIELKFFEIDEFLTKKEMVVGGPEKLGEYESSLIQF